MNISPCGSWQGEMPRGQRGFAVGRGGSVKRWPTKPDDWYRLKPLARELRRTQTEAEQALWAAIRGRKVAGFRFQRQRVFRSYVVDFYCPEARLVIEVDGPIHDKQQDKDANRQTQLEDYGFRFLR